MKTTIQMQKDIWSRREQINNYSNNNGKGVTK